MCAAVPVKKSKTERLFKIIEKNGDLFSCDTTDALAHCVSQDLRMGKGIALNFKKKFGQIDDLKKQAQKVGGVAVIQHEGRYIYYLITKEKYFLKPTYETLRQSLEAMKKHCVDHNVKALSIPKIGCGLDKLEWSTVLDIIKETFQDVEITITVYSI